MCGWFEMYTYKQWVKDLACDHTQYVFEDHNHWQKTQKMWLSHVHMQQI